MEYYVVCVRVFKWNNQPPKKKKKKKRCSLVSLKWDFHIEISHETGTRETVFVVVDRLKWGFIVI